MNQFEVTFFDGGTLRSVVVSDYELPYPGSWACWCAPNSGVGGVVVKVERVAERSEDQA